MNLNYIGSVAERFMKFSSGVFPSEGVSEELFDSLLVYVPSSLALDNLIDVDIYGVTEKPEIVIVDVANYREKLKGDLLTQWEPVFNQDTNFSVTLIIVVFFVPNATLAEDAQIVATEKRGLATTAEGVLTGVLGTLTTEKGTLTTLKGTLTTSQTEYGEAEIALEADPTNPALVSALADALLALNNAQTAVNAQQLVVDTAQIAVDSAQEDFDAKNSSALIVEEFVEFSDRSYLDFLTVTTNEIEYSFLSVAMEKTFFAGFFKFLFTKNYNGQQVSGHDERWYFDLALCLASLCKQYRSLSYAVLFTHLKVPVNGLDTNKCLGMSVTYEEEDAITGLNLPVSGFTDPRNQLFFGMLKFIEADNTWVIAHSENVYVPSRVFGKLMMSKNATGTFIGNKLAKIRLSGNKIKPTGLPSVFDSSVNENLPKIYSENLDKKNVAYLISIADDTPNDAMIVRARGMTGFPVIPVTMSKWIDNTTSLQMAKLVASNATLTNPILRNETAYNRIREQLLSNIQVFARIGRVKDIQLNFPPFSSLSESKTDITVTGGWQATYVDDLEKVVMTGAISV